MQPQLARFCKRTVVSLLKWKHVRVVRVIIHGGQAIVVAVDIAEFVVKIVIFDFLFVVSEMILIFVVIVVG